MVNIFQHQNTTSQNTVLDGDPNIRVVRHRLLQRERADDGEVVPSAGEFFEQRLEPVEVTFERHRRENEYIRASGNSRDRDEQCTIDN